MKFLLFLLGVSYFFIFFFLFSRGIHSEYLSLFWQGQIYIIIVLGCILYTLEMKSFTSSQKQKLLSDIHFKKSFYALKSSLRDNLYFIGIIFLYISFYLILRGLYEDITIHFIFFIVNLGTILVFFLTQKSHTLSHILQGNTIIVSLFYSVSHVLFLFGAPIHFSLIDIGNLILISVLFILLFSSDKDSKKLYYTAIHALIFYLLECAILLYFLIAPEYFLISLIVFLSGVIHIFYYLPDILSRLSSIPQVFFLRYGTLLSIILILLYILSLFIFPTALMFSGFLVCIHAFYLFLHYYSFSFFPSLLFALIGMTSAILGYIMSLAGVTFLLHTFSTLFLTVSLGVFVFPYIKKYVLVGHLYQLHFIFLGINIIGCVLFFVFRDFSILYMGYLFLFEALYFMANSYLFKKIY